MNELDYLFLFKLTHLRCNLHHTVVHQNHRSHNDQKVKTGLVTIIKKQVRS